MNINTIENQLSQIYFRDSEKVNNNRQTSSLEKVESDKLQDFKQKVNEPESIITKNEKNFFKKMFPENSDSIDRHVVFNRNGKVQESNFALGTIFDGRF